MSAKRHAIYMACAAALLCAGCAISPDVESRRQAIEADIDEILSLPLDPAEFGDVKSCLADTQYRNFRPLGDRHILFEGRRNRQWVNTLRGRCRDLRYDGVLVMRSFSSTRMCDADRFQVTDWFAYPWYRRWPWHWGSWGTGATCALANSGP